MQLAEIDEKLTNLFRPRREKEAASCSVNKTGYIQNIPVSLHYFIISHAAQFFG